MNFKKILFSLFFVFIFLNLISLPNVASAAANISATLNLVSGGISNAGSSAPTSSGSVTGTFWNGNFVQSTATSWSISGTFNFSTIKAVKFHVAYPERIWNGCICGVDPAICNNTFNRGCYTDWTGCNCQDQDCCFGATCDLNKCLRAMDSDYYYFCKNGTATLSGSMSFSGCSNTVGNIPTIITYQAYDMDNSTNKGLCGSAKNVGTLSAPTSGLCAHGTASAVSADSTIYSWTCTDCGTTTSCNAPRQAFGVCNTTTSGVATYTKPTTNLCYITYNTPIVSGTGPWTWNCTGTNGGATDHCSAPKKIDGVCGSNDKQNLSSQPTTGLCSAGTASSITHDTVNHDWTWKCNSTAGGLVSTPCIAYEKINGSCGSAGKLYGTTPHIFSIVKPASNLCGYTSSSTTPITTDTDTDWNWKCNGIHTGTSATCITYLKGSCGIAVNNHYTSTPPANVLCATGSASAVSGGTSGNPYTWTCKGAEGSASATVSCGAPYDGVCGSAVDSTIASPKTTKTYPLGTTTFGTATSSTFCSNGISSPVTPLFPSLLSTIPYTTIWTCAGSKMTTLVVAGTTPTCTAKVTVNGVCNNLTTCTNTAPTGSLCQYGYIKTPPGIANPGETTSPWSWTCGGYNTGTDSPTCTAPTKGVCGTATTNGTASCKPESSGCSVGTACSEGVVSSDGITGGDGSNPSNPWQWTCVGSDSTNTSCSQQCTAPLHGTCGLANNKTYPAGSVSFDTDTLCGSGDPYFALNNPSYFYYNLGQYIEYSQYIFPSYSVTTPPYTTAWTCKGSSDDTASNCTAKLAIDGTCSTYYTAGHSDPTYGPSMFPICKVGVASNVMPNYPSDGYIYYTWTCTGYNGGITASCTTLLCDSSANSIMSEKPATNLCIGNAINSTVTGNGPWTWTCTLGQFSSTCSTKANGTCGTAAGGPITGTYATKTYTQTEAWPNGSYCITGAQSISSTTLDTWTIGQSTRTWTCQGSGGGANQYCKVNRMVNGLCGNANNKSYADGAAFSWPYNLCGSGGGTPNPTNPILSNTPGSTVTWTCAGYNGGDSSPICTATRLGSIKVDGACGTADKSFSLSAPTSNLCTKGTASTSSGSGPWTWTCAGTGTGHTDASCTANVKPSNLTASVNNCPNVNENSNLLTKTSLVSLSWLYLDGQGNVINPNYHYTLKISNTNNINAPYDYLGTEKTISVVDNPQPGQAQIAFGDGTHAKTYYWWIQLTDANGNTSDWIPAPSSFTAPPHYYPTPEIAYAPTSPLARNPVYLDATQSVSFNEPTYLWTLTNNTTSQLSKVSRTYNEIGKYTEQLKTCDKNNYCCTISVDIHVKNALSLPQWKEVSPF